MFFFPCSCDCFLLSFVTLVGEIEKKLCIQNENVFEQQGFSLFLVLLLLVVGVVGMVEDSMVGKVTV